MNGRAIHAWHGTVLAHLTSWRASCIFAGAALAPILTAAWYVNEHANSAPVGDQWWDVVYIAVKTKAGILTLDDLLTYAGGHRNVTIKVITAISTALTDFDVRVLRFATFVAALGCFVLSLVLISRSERQLTPLAALLLSVALFTLYDTKSWLDYYFSVWHQATLFFLLGLVVIQRMQPGLLAFGLCVLCAVAAGFSGAIGPMAWFCFPIAALGTTEYRRFKFCAVWLAATAAFFAFYFSSYAHSATEAALITLPQSIMQDGLWQTLLTGVRFLSVRFDAHPAKLVLAAVIVTTACIAMFAINLWTIFQRKREDAALWASLAAFSFGGALMVMMGRNVGYWVPGRYSPGSDAFWIALVAVALISLRRSASLWIPNLLLVCAVAGLSGYKTFWTIRYAPVPYPKSCDRCVADFPLQRGSCFRSCFQWGEEQSVYHLAGLRLSIFRDAMPVMILPSNDSPVISDMPSRWLGVFVRDFMLASLDPKLVHTLAPVPGHWPLPKQPFSPFYRGEWPVDILPQPLSQATTELPQLLSKLPVITAGSARIWYLNTPETAGHFPAVEQGLNELGFKGSRVTIASPRYAAARFGLWCFERSDTGACAAATGQGNTR